MCDRGGDKNLMILEIAWHSNQETSQVPDSGVGGIEGQARPNKSRIEYKLSLSTWISYENKMH